MMDVTERFFVALAIAGLVGLVLTIGIAGMPTHLF
jgi:hypothetical protein